MWFTTRTYNATKLFPRTLYKKVFLLFIGVFKNHDSADARHTPVRVSSMTHAQQLHAHQALSLGTSLQTWDSVQDDDVDLHYYSVKTWRYMMAWLCYCGRYQLNVFAPHEHQCPCRVCLVYVVFGPGSWARRGSYGCRRFGILGHVRAFCARAHPGWRMEAKDEGNWGRDPTSRLTLFFKGAHLHLFTTWKYQGNRNEGYNHLWHDEASESWIS